MTSSPQLLIVDDDPFAIQVLNQALQGLGEICFAASGREALSLLQAKPIDLAMLEAQMPVMDGFETCRAIRLEFPQVPIIFVTASSSPESEIRALNAGAVDFFNKPINPQVFRARVEKYIQLKRQSDELRALIKTDPLTGIPNRRALEEQSTREWRRARRNRQPLAVLMIDIDHFKAYNDHYGHVAGDVCLRQVAQAIEASVMRPGDLTVRFGGEEFAVLLPESSGPQAVIVAEKIRAAVRALAIPHARSPISDRVTVSIGCAAGVPRHPPDPNEQSVGPEASASGHLETNRLETLFDSADAALYAAKQAGRDRVVLQQPPTGA